MSIFFVEAMPCSATRLTGFHRRILTLSAKIPVEMYSITGIANTGLNI